MFKFNTANKAVQIIINVLAPIVGIFVSGRSKEPKFKNLLAQKAHMRFWFILNK